jgi:hypothetical protein
MDLYVVSARRPIRHRVASHLDRAAYEPEPPFHAARQAHELVTVCGARIEDPLYAFPDSPYDAEPSFARCPQCEAELLNVR